MVNFDTCFVFVRVLFEFEREKLTRGFNIT